MANPRELDIASAVGVFDPTKLQNALVLSPEAFSSIEKGLGETIQVSNAASQRGGGQALLIQRHQVDMLLIADRLEVRSLAPDFGKKNVQMMAKLWEEVISKYSELGTIPWMRVGYNFILRTESDDLAIEHLRNIFLHPKLGNNLGKHTIMGGAPSVWLDVDGERLWLRATPFRGNLEEHRIGINANFTRECDDPTDFPTSTEIASQLLASWEKLKLVLDYAEL